MSNISYLTQSHTNIAVKELEGFLSDEKLRSVKDSPYTNVSDQVRGYIYSIPFDSSRINNLPCDTIQDKSPSNYCPIRANESDEEDADDDQDQDDPDQEHADDDNQDHDNETSLTPSKDRPREEMSKIDEFFELLDKARRTGAVLNYCERQYFTIPSSTNRPYLTIENMAAAAAATFDPEDLGTPVEEDVNDVDKPVKRSCIMLDFDIYQPTANSQLTETDCYSLVHNITKLIHELFDIETLINRNDGNYTIHVAFTRKPEILPVKHPKYGNCYKDGIHLLIFAKITRAAKDYLIKQILEKNALHDAFKRMQLCCPINDILDKASAYVPVLFHGCSKSGKEPYELLTVYESIIGSGSHRVRDIHKFDTGEIKPTRKRDPHNRKKWVNLPPDEKTYEDRFNIPHELSLHYESPGGLIKKQELELRASVREEARIYSERTDGKLISEHELQEIDYAIADLAVRNSEVKYIQKVLSLMKPERVREYDDWKSVLVILARENPDYKPLAIWFSQRYAKSWIKGGITSLNKIWDWALSHPASEDTNMRRLGTLIEWAKQDNPEEMRKAQEQSTQVTILKFAMENTGRLSDQNLADILYIMFRRKFVCDMNAHSASAANALEWYEFVLPSDNMGLDKGSLYKYRRELNPDNLEIYISKKLPLQIANVNDWLDKKVEETAEDEAKQKWYKKIKANLIKTCERLGNAVAAAGILKKCRLVFRIRGFINQLDKDPNVLGVGNGVLKLYPNTELIQRYHDNPISRFTPVDYIEYDPSNPYIKELERAIRDLFADEEDAYYFTMCYLASSLDARNKNPLLYLWMGEGSNGKSFLLELHINMLGNVVAGGYGTKMSIAFLTKERKDGPDSEKMLLKHARFAYFSESDAGDYIRTGNVKEITGGENVSAAEKFQKQDNFRVHCHFVVATNNDPRISGSDHGTWRRILVYRFKMKLCDNPDPNNKYEKKVDRRFADVVNRSPEYLSAYIAIMGKYYALYRDKYNYNLDNIPRPSIDRDTEHYRNEQDTINRFITHRVIYIGAENENGEPTEHISLQDLANKYIEWYRASIADVKLLTMDIVKVFQISRLKKYVQKKHTGDFLTCHRILGKNESYDPDKPKTPSKQPQIDMDEIIDDLAQEEEENMIMNSVEDPVTPEITTQELVDDLEE